MARLHAGLLTSIWSDTEFLALPPLPQRLYLFLISQPDLTFAGSLALRPTRWATKASPYTARAARRDLDQLLETRFVVVDDDTEELLVRTFVRNSGIWKQPQVMRRMSTDVALIDSGRLLDVLRDELTRIPLDTLNDEAPANGGPSLRKTIHSIIDAIVYGDHPPATLTRTPPGTLEARAS